MKLKEELTDSRINQNFWSNIASGGASKLADQLASPSLVLPWILSALNAPTYLIGFLVPIRRGVALLPQLAISARIQSKPQKKPFWVAGAIAQGVAILGMALSAVFASGLTAGLLILLFLTLFSLARSVGSLTFKDVLAKSMTKDKRGQVLAGRAILGGTTSLIATVVLRFFVGESTTITPYIILLIIASLSWFLAAFLFYQIKEIPGKTTKTNNLINQAKEGWKLIKIEPDFTRFLIVRIAYISIGLSLPFYTLLAKDALGSAFSALMTLIILKGAAEIISSFFWGKITDISAKHVLLSIGLISLVSSLLALNATQISHAFILIPLLLITAIDRGQKIARDTYLVNATPNDTRPLYTAITNTVTGSLTLAAGSLSLLTTLISTQMLLVIFGSIAAIGTLIAWTLPEKPSFT